MAFGPDPITAEAARNALVSNDRLDARAKDSGANRAKLDAEELRELEQSLYVRSTAAGPNVIATTSPRRSLLDRLLRRG